MFEPLELFGWWRRHVLLTNKECFSSDKLLSITSNIVG